MEIVIELDEILYGEFLAYGIVGLNVDNQIEISKAIRKGTPLPKGHGRLIDESKITKWCCMPINQLDGGGIRTDAPTIIEGSEKNECK